MVQSAFKISVVTKYFELMRELAEQNRANLQDRQIVDIASMMAHLTYRVVGMALMSEDLSHTGNDVEIAMAAGLAYIYRRINQPALPMFIPTPANIFFKRQRRRLHHIVDDILLKRKAGKVVNDLLAEMLAAKNAEQDARLNNRWLRDEVVTLLLAGHETTANALTFCLYLLARHPNVQQRLYSEIQAVIAQRQISLSDLERLPYTTQVIQESMRLYPPIWALERFVKNDAQLGGYHIPGGSTLFISIYAMHRHTELWQDAEKFNPDRFAEKNATGAYMPFGMGPRMCLGMNFALQEALIILVSLLQKFEVVQVSPQEVQVEAGITLRVAGQLPLQLILR